MSKSYHCSGGLTGGVAGALDAIVNPTDKDIAFVHFNDDVTYGNAILIYTFDGDSAAGESAPNIIAPDTGSGEWELVSVFADSLQMTIGTIINEFSIDGTLAGNSDSAVPTEKAVKTYSDTKIPKSDYNAKGKILVGIAAATYAALSVGSDDQVLTADSGEVTGVKWAASCRTIGDRTIVGAADYNPSILTSDYIIAITNTAVARAVIISIEDEDSGSSIKPRIIIVKDESGGAAAHNITISLESGGNIDGIANYIINQNYQSITLYIDGTNAFII